MSDSAFEEYRVWYRTAADGRAPALLTLPGPDYEMGPRARAYTPRDIQIELNRLNAALAPPPVEDMGYGAIPEDDEDTEEWLDAAASVPPALSIGDAVVRERDGQAWVLCENGWASAQWRPGKVGGGA